MNYDDNRLVKHEDIDLSDGYKKGGRQKLYHFKNGYGASVVKHEGSYGGKSGLWELAVLDAEGSLCYDTEITDDVIGHLNDPQVDALLNQIANLKG
jgi:hypothetical protein|tara:strand:+ start:523 stop:810 length:288 start_codon:yes stop_codon:yes gene_type:complete